MADSLNDALQELDEMSVVTSGDTLVINNDLRTITVPANFIFGVYNDKNVLSVDFEMPRYYDDIDLSTFSIQINYQAASGVGNIYEITTPVIGTDKITFEWLLDRGVFLKAGDVTFIVCLREILSGSEGTILREFNTTVARGKVLEGLEVEDPEDPEAYSIIAHLKSIDQRVTAQASDVANKFAAVSSMASEATSKYNEAIAAINGAKEFYGSPLVAATAAAMTDTNKVYVYTGSETGYTVGNWYHYDGTNWVSGGVYNSAAVNTDETLSVSGMAADSAKVGQEISGLKEDLSALVPPVDAVWVLNTGINTSGTEYDTNYLATTNVIKCTPGTIFVTDAPTVDSNNKFLVWYIVEYNNGQFIKRVELTSAIRTVKTTAETNQIRLVFGRYGSSGVNISQNDIDTFATFILYQALASKVELDSLDEAGIINRGIYSGNNVSDISTNSIYYVPGAVQGTPVPGAAFYVLTIIYNITNTASAMQIAIRFRTGMKYYRQKVSNSWNEWSTYDYTADNFIQNGYNYSGSDANNIIQNSFYFCAEGVANLPTESGGYFVNTVLYNESATAAVQIAYKYINGLIYYRRKVSNSWRPWVCLTAHTNPSDPLYYAFGDSLTYGAVWTPTDTSPYYEITQASVKNQMPTRIANAVGSAYNFVNNGVGGAYFVGEGTNKIINKIQSSTLTNAKLITVAGGRNDSANPLGDKNSVIGDGTICGAIKEILEYLTSNFKQAQIVWIGVTPNTRDNSTVFTRVFAGGWSLNTFDEKVSELCAEYGVPYIDWKSCTYIRHWADYSGAGDVYSHPNNEESYLQMGNYLAGRVASYYKG